jgi:bifunctional DNase/RNase
MRIQMVVSGLTIDPMSHAPVLILRALRSERVLPLHIGVIEAKAIACELHKHPSVRPMAHDLLRRTIEMLGGSVRRVVIHALRDNTYYAQIDVVKGRKVFCLDASPSDAVALALRAGAPILCHTDVIMQTAVARRAAQGLLQQGLPMGLRAPRDVTVRTARAPRRSDLHAQPKVFEPQGLPHSPGSEATLKALLGGLRRADFGKFKM